MDSEGFLHEVEREGFTLISIIGVMDIIRPEVPDAIA